MEAKLGNKIRITKITCSAVHKKRQCPDCNIGDIVTVVNVDKNDDSLMFTTIKSDDMLKENNYILRNLPKGINWNHCYLKNIEYVIAFEGFEF